MEVPHYYEDQWMAVTDEEPDAGTICLVLIAPQGQDTAILEAEWDGATWRIGSTLSMFFLEIDITQHITHWMPRPGEPKEQVLCFDSYGCFYTQNLINQNGAGSPVS